MNNIIKRIIDEWDPVELLSIHCPHDEYDEISAKISTYLKKEQSNLHINDFSKKIMDIFAESFGIDTFDKTLDDCKKIAKKILSEVRRKKAEMM